jgi:hypothetical protein
LETVWREWKELTGLTGESIDRKNDRKRVKSMKTKESG